VVTIESDVELAQTANDVLGTLRTLLAEDRAAGFTFASVSPEDVGVPVRPLSVPERQSWAVALSQTRGAWESAYEGTGKVPVGFEPPAEVVEDGFDLLDG